MMFLIGVLFILMIIFLIVKIAMFTIMSISSFIFLFLITFFMIAGGIFDIDGGTIIVVMILLITGILQGKRAKA